MGNEMKNEIRNLTSVTVLYFLGFMPFSLYSLIVLLFATPFHGIPSHGVPSHEIPSHEIPSHEIPSDEIPSDGISWSMSSSLFRSFG